MNRLKCLLLLVLVGVATNVFADDPVPYLSPPMTVAELQKTLAVPRTYQVVGYLIKNPVECPECPPNAVCETCMQSVWITDYPAPPSAGVSTRGRLHVNADMDFVSGVRYLVTIAFQPEVRPYMVLLWPTIVNLIPLPEPPIQDKVPGE
jgi:hypothetical protein